MGRLQSDSSLPLPDGERPDWRPLVDYYLERFRSDGVTPAEVDQLEQWAANATAFDATGSCTLAWECNCAEAFRSPRLCCSDVAPDGGRALPRLPALDLSLERAAELSAVLPRRCLSAPRSLSPSSAALAMPLFSPRRVLGRPSTLS